MAAPEGNQNAIGNDGGRPPIHTDPEVVKNLCESYFVNDLHLLDNRSPTITGLALWLGFDSKTTLYEYAKKIEFSNHIKRAITQIEKFHEERAGAGKDCTGNIFVLKNFGWHDTIKTEHSGYIATPEKPLTPEQAKQRLAELNSK